MQHACYVCMKHSCYLYIYDVMNVVKCMLHVLYMLDECFLQVSLGHAYNMHVKFHETHIN